MPSHMPRPLVVVIGVGAGAGAGEAGDGAWRVRPRLSDKGGQSPATIGEGGPRSPWGRLPQQGSADEDGKG